MIDIYSCAKDFRRLHRAASTAHGRAFGFIKEQAEGNGLEVWELMHAGTPLASLLREAEDRFAEWDQAVLEVCASGRTSTGNPILLSSSVRNPVAPVGVVWTEYEDVAERAYDPINDLTHPTPLGLLRFAWRRWSRLSDDEKSIFVAITAGWLATGVRADRGADLHYLIGEVPLALAEVEPPRLIVQNAY